MNHQSLTPIEQSVLNLVKREHLPSYEILKNIDNISMLLSVYNIIDKLKKEGRIKSYLKGNVKYHFAC